MIKNCVALFGFTLIASASGMIISFNSDTTQEEKDKFESGIKPVFRKEILKTLHSDVVTYLEKYPQSALSAQVNERIDGDLNSILYMYGLAGILTRANTHPWNFSEQMQTIKNSMRAEMGLQQLTLKEEKKYIATKKSDEYLKNIKEYLGDAISSYIYGEQKEDPDSKVMQNFVRLAIFDSRNNYMDMERGSAHEWDIVNFFQNVCNCIGPLRLNFLKTGEGTSVEKYPHAFRYDMQTQNEGKKLFDQTLQRLKLKANKLP